MDEGKVGQGGGKGGAFTGFSSKLNVEMQTEQFCSHSRGALWLKLPVRAFQILQKTQRVIADHYTPI